MNQPFEECPRYDRCSVNRCPLDPEQDQRTIHPQDKEQKCPMEKPVRLRIGSKYPDLLPRLGLTVKEWASRQAYANLSPSQKQAAIDRLKATQFRKSGDNEPKTPKT